MKQHAIRKAAKYHSTYDVLIIKVKSTFTEKAGRYLLKSSVSMQTTSKEQLKVRPHLTGCSHFMFFLLLTLREHRTTQTEGQSIKSLA